MLNADGETDGIGADALFLQLLRGELAVGCRGGMDDQTLSVCYIGQKREELQMVDEAVGLFRSPPNFKGKNRRAALGKILLKQGMVGVLRKGGMVDPLYQRMGRQIAYHLPGIIPVALQTQG